MTFSIQLFAETANSFGLAHDLSKYRLKSIYNLSPYEIRVSAKSHSPARAQHIPGMVHQVGWAPRAHQALGSATMVGNKLPTLQAAQTL